MSFAAEVQKLATRDKFGRLFLQHQQQKLINSEFDFRVHAIRP